MLKIGEFQNVLRTSHADIAVRTETKLTQEKMSLTESAIDGFHAPLRLDRTGQGGGVAVWIKEDLAYEHLSAIDCGPHEIIWPSIKLKSKEKLPSIDLALSQDTTSLFLSIRTISWTPSAGMARTYSWLETSMSTVRPGLAVPKPLLPANTRRSSAQFTACSNTSIALRGEATLWT